MLEAILLILMLFADRLTKALVRGSLPLGGSRALWPGVAALRHVENTGAAFSLLSGQTWPLSLLTAAILAAVAVYLVRHRELPMGIRLSLCMVLAGGLGNLFDRVAYGQVTDFIELLFVRFAVFNVADICITCGAVLLGILVLLQSGKNGGRT